MNQLIWTSKDGVETAQGFGFKYEVQTTGEKLCPWEVWITWGFDKSPEESDLDVTIEEVPTIEIGKHLAQSHHDAICAMIQNAKDELRIDIEAVFLDKILKEEPLPAPPVKEGI